MASEVLSLANHELLRLVVVAAPDPRALGSMLLTSKAFLASLLPEDLPALRKRFLIKKKDVRSDNSRVVYTVLPNGRKEGACRTWNYDGILRSEGHYVDGRKEGPYVKYYPSGKVSKRVHFAGGLKEGEEKAWYANGVLRLRRCYEGGHLVSHETWFYTGQSSTYSLQSDAVPCASAG